MSQGEKQVMGENEQTHKNVKLTDLLNSVTSAFVAARIHMDEASIEIAEKYSKNVILSTLPLPFFSISEVMLHLKFALRKTEETGEVAVSVDAASLEKLPQHVISQIDFKLSPQLIKAYKTEKGVVFSSSPSS